jgi:hypothetical protein
MAALVTVVGCRDEGPAKPSAIEIISGAGQIGAAGERLASSPTFVVRDSRGRAMAAVPVEVRVTGGGGTLSNAPTVTSSGPSTSVGEWILGQQAGTNELTITVPGVSPARIRVAGNAGAPAKLLAINGVAITGRVGEQAPPISVRLTDAFDNSVPLAQVRLLLTGGGLAPEFIFTDSQGMATIAGWTLTTVPGKNVLTLTAGSATLAVTATVAPGAPDRIEVVSGSGQLGRAGTPLEAPIVVRVVDKYGNLAPSEPVQFSVTTGGGTLASTAALLADDGLVSAPIWTLGRTALPQTLHIASGGISTDVVVGVKTDFNIDVRFYGQEMTAEQKSAFTDAAARLAAIITGDIPDTPAMDLNLADYCGLPGVPAFSEPLDDVVIFASIGAIDGAGKVLARAGPCLFRGANYGGFAAFGVMEFDEADVGNMATNGTLQSVITHEMLHVLGIGTAWTMKGLLTGARTSASTYIGAQGRQGCVDGGGDAVCTTGVPVENNGVIGTADSHWRETTFQTELMTGYSSTSGMPLSKITVGALADLGYVVNPFAADPYRLPAPAIFSRTEIPAVEWERRLPKQPGVIP